MVSFYEAVLLEVPLTPHQPRPHSSALCFPSHSRHSFPRRCERAAPSLLRTDASATKSFAVDAASTAALAAVSSPRVAGERHEAARDGGRPATAAVRSVKALRDEENVCGRTRMAATLDETTSTRRDCDRAFQRVSTALGEGSTKVDGRGKAGGTQHVCRDRVTITRYGTRRRERHERRAAGNADEMCCLEEERLTHDDRQGVRRRQRRTSRGRAPRMSTRGSDDLGRF